MDVEYDEISIKEEPFDDEMVIKLEHSEEMKKNDGTDEQTLEQILKFQKIQEGRCISDVDIKTEIEIKKESSSVIEQMEPPRNSQNFEQISGINEWKHLIDCKDELLTQTSIKEESLKEEIESEKDLFKRLTKSKFPLVVVQKLRIKDLKDLYVEEMYKQHGDSSRCQELVEEETTTEKQHRKKVRCSNCNLIFESEDKLGSHLESFCERRRKCPQRGCGRNCESDLKACLLNCKSVDKSDVKRKLFKCSKCSYECTQKRYLKQHILKHQNIKLFKCSECNYECNQKVHLKSHLLKHETIKLFKCLECNYACNEKGSLKLHMLKHQNIKLFKCSECNYECNQKSNLKSHLLTHRKIKLFKCSECNYECNQKGNLKRHLLTHENKFFFKCSQCEYESNQKSDLNLHMLKHENIKVFKCSECIYACNKKSNLKSHLLTHANIKLFKCSECNYESNRKDRLKKHLLRHVNIQAK